MGWGPEFPQPLKKGNTVPCYHPIRAWRDNNGVVFRETPDSQDIKLPCGGCIGCKLERSRQWALRLVHENRLHDSSSFITLTYDNAHLPYPPSINPKDFQDFMKRLRKDVYPKKVRFFHSGEYGDVGMRPHYHAIIFGQDFADKMYDVETTDRGDIVWSSPVLDRLWPFGMNRVGVVTFESCAYVARYVVKKVNGRRAKVHYEWYDPIDGEAHMLHPEYATMSRRPGIGSDHVKRYLEEIYPRDECIARGFASKPPKFYDKVLEKLSPEVYAQVKEQRECALALDPNKSDRSDSRLTRS